jgi:hypothetical protein
MIFFKRKCAASARVFSIILLSGLLSAFSAHARSLLVESSPSVSATVLVSPADTNGATDGSTTFTRNYPDSTIVTLTATNAIGSYRFQKWLNNGVDFENGLTATVTMNADHTLRAVYVEVAPVFPADMQIMPLGDSITYGYNGTNAGYRGPLYGQLSPLAPTFRYIGTSSERTGSLPVQPINQRLHEGHSSYSIQVVSNNLDGFDNSTFLQYGGIDRDPNGGFWLVGGNGTSRAPVFPNVITMMVGTNDLDSPVGVEDRLRSLVDKITTLRPETNLLVAKITPAPAFSTDEDYNMIVPNVVADFQAAGKKVHLVDLNTGFPTNGLIADQIHPNDIGFNWMAAKWFQAIEAVYSPAAIARPLTPVALPGTVEAENFDLGGNGIAYQDQTRANEGGQYRPEEGVDIRASGDEGAGHEVYQTEAGEWLQYTVNVNSPGGFSPSLRVANPLGGGEVYLEIDGINVTNNVAIPSTGGFGVWQTVLLPRIQLSAGNHVVKLVISATSPGGTAGAINWLSITAEPKAPPSARAGADLTVEDLDHNGFQSVTLDASATIAGDSPTLSYQWLRAGVVIATGISPTVNLPLGTQVIQLTVTDGEGLQGTDEVLVTVSPKTLLNGSFESGLTNWTTSGNLTLQDAAPFSPTDGTKLVGFNGGNLTPNGILSQSFATAVGGNYTLQFDAGVLSYNSNPQTMRVTVNGSSNLLTETIVITGIGGGTNRWLPQSITFVANSASSTVAFRDISGSTVGVDLLLDNLRVSGPSALPSNRPPLAVADSFSTNEATPLVVPSGGLLANDSDPDENPLAAVINVRPIHGTLNLGLDGGFTYTPKVGFFGTDSFSYHASDGFLNSNIVTVNLAMNEVIPPPVSAADTYSTQEGKTLTVPASGTLSNDSDPRSRPLTAVLNAGPSHGTLNLNPNGRFTYTPFGGFFGRDTFTYHSRNGYLDSNIVAVQITVNEVIPPPVAFANSYVTNESIQLSISAPGVLGNDFDPRFRPLTAVLNAGPSHGTLSLNANGSFVYTPANGYFGSDSFTYRARNGLLNSKVVTVNLTIHEVIPAPVAVADSYSTNEGTPLVITGNGLLINDTDLRSRPLMAVLNDGPSHGSLTLADDGSFVYNPAYGYFGNDSFTYRANNGSLNSEVTSVNLTVNEVIPPPVAADDAYVTDEDVELTVPANGVLANDSDPRARPLTAILNSGPDHGTLGLNADGSFTYLPDEDYFGPDSFTYHARNGFLDSGIRTVSLTVNEVIPPPLAVADSYSTNEGSSLVVSGNGLLANDTDPRARDLTSVLDEAPSHGTVVMATDGSFIYDPNPGFFGNDSFTYHANNGFLDSNLVSVSVTVNEVVPPPVAVEDAFETDEDIPLTVPATGVLANDSDLRARPLTAILDVGPPHGLLTFNVDGSFVYTPAEDYFGPDSFTYHANNGFLDSDIATVNLTVNEVVPAPIATADSYSTEEGTSLVIAGDGVLANDADPRSRPLSAILNVGPANGALTLALNGDFTYTPASGFYGADSFTYHATNGFVDSDVVTVSLTVNEVVPPAVAIGDVYQTDGNLQLVVPVAGVLANDSDPRSRPIIAILDNGPSHGVLALNENGSFTYTPELDYSGPDSFTYHASNGFLDSNIVTVEITVETIYPPPVAGDDTYSTNENSPLVIRPANGLLANDTDAESLPLEAVLDIGPVHGTLALNPNGSFTYTPAVSYFGNDAFTYHASNGTRESNIATVNLTVNEVVPAPVTVNDSYSTNEDVPLAVASTGVLANDSDPRARPLTAIVDSFPSHGTLVLDPEGGFTYTPDSRYFGTDSFSYHANNGSVDSVPTTVNLVINEVIPPPVASADSYSVDQGAILTIAAQGVLSNDSDPRARPLTAILDAGPSHGSLNLNSSGAFIYTPTPGYTGPDSFAYHANNGFLNSNVVTVLITVRPPTFVGLVNGGFEANFTGWTISGSQNIQSAAPYVPTEGSNLVGFNGANLTPNAILSQTFVTVPGQSYTLAFDLGVLAFNTNSQTMQATVNGTGNLLSRTITIFGVSGSNRWFPQSYSFTADSASTTLTFRDQSTSSQGLDMTLDNVRVTGPPPSSNNAPVAIADTFSTEQDATLSVPAPGVIANDTDSESQPLTAFLVATAAHGTVAMGTNGSFTYTPTGGYYGTDSFTYRVNDGSLNSNVVTVSLTITRKNTAPVAAADSYSADQDTALVISAPGVLSNDTDAQSQPLTAILNSGPAHGTINLNASGGFTYTPFTGYFGPDSFTYHASDGSLDSNVATVSINVVKGNSPPEAVADSYSVNQDTTLDVPSSGVLANDSDEESQPLTSILDSGPGNGSVTLFNNGRFIYVPNPGYFGPDSFTYHANDGSSNSNVVSVSLTVNMLNTPPVAYADSYSTAQDTALVIVTPGVLENDTDAHSQPLTAILNAGPGHGSLTLGPDGGFTYTPTTGYFGTDSFSYHANDGALDSNIVTASITVTKAILAPTVVADAYSTDEGQSLVVPAAGVLANDTDPQDLALIAVQDAGPAHGNLTLNSDGSFTYVPAPNYFGADSFSYHADNGTVDSSPVTVSLTINEVVPAPVANSDSYSVIQNGSIVVPAAGVLSNDSDPRSRPLAAIMTAGPAHGTLNLTANGAFTYSPTPGYTGSDSFTYHANNGFRDSNVATVAITVHPPAFTGLVNGGFESDFTGWTISGNQNVQSSLPYVPTQGSKLVGFNGADLTPNAILSQSFATVAGQIYTLKFDLGVLAFNTNSQTMRVTVDGTGSLLNKAITIFGVTGTQRWFPQTYAFTANSATTTLTFRDQSASTLGLDMTLDNAMVSGPPPPANTAPVAAADSYSTAQNVVLTIPSLGVLANDTDAEFQGLTAILNVGPSHGSLTLNANGSFTYNPASGYFGPDSFTYHANDGSLDSNGVSVNLTVNMVNYAPVATDDSYAAVQDTVLNVPVAGVLANDADPELQPLAAILDIAPSHGSVFLNTDGSFTYTPDTGYFGTDSFTYRANDGSLDSNVAIVSLTIAKANTAPLAEADSYSINQDTPLIVPAPGLLANDSDDGSQPPTAVLDIAPSHGNLVLNADGSFSYLPTSGYFGPDAFTYHADDGSLDSNGVTVTLTINEVDSPPVANPDSYTTNEGIQLVVPVSGVLANDTDAQSQLLTAAIDTAPAHGTLVFNANGSFTYSPMLGYFGPDSFTYHANDGALDSNIATVSITIDEVIPPPAAVSDSYSTNEGAALVVFASGLLTNDSDPRARPLTAVLDSAPTHGTVTLNANGKFTYTPDAEYFGNDSFTYHANNGTLDSNIATVSITVDEVIFPPMAIADSYSTNEGTALVVAASGVLANDNDPRSRPLTAVADSGPLHGTIALNANGSFTYTPGSGYFGNDSFTYHSNNGALNSDVVTVDITIHQIITGALVNGSFEAGFAGWTISGNLFTEGTAPYTPTDGAILAGFNGANLSPNAVLSQTVAAIPGQYYTLTFDLGVVSFNTNSQTMQVTVNGTNVILNKTLNIFGLGGGAIRWVPQSFTFMADSSQVLLTFRDQSSSTQGLDMTLDNVVIAESQNTAPVATADTYQIDQDTTLNVPAAGVLANDTDAQSQALDAVLNTGPAHGNLALNTNGSFSYVPTAGYFGSDSFTYHANDGVLDSNIVTVTLTINQVNFAPVATADSYSTNQNTALTVPASGVLANDSDAESPPLTAVVNTGPSHGTLSLNTNGGFTYTPVNGYSGGDSFTYHANDGSLDSNVVTVSLNVIPFPAIGIFNGSFESGYAGWTATGNQAIQNAPIYAPTNGSNVVGFNAANLAPNGVLYQSFGTAPGQTCTLTFDAGVFAYNTNSQTLRVTVTGANPLLERTIILFGPANGTSIWQSQTYTFVADSTTTTLTFRDQSASTQAIDLLLDNVKVISSSSSLPPGSSTETEGTSSSELGTASLTVVPGNITVGMEATLPGTYFLERSEDLRHWERISEEEVSSPKTIEFHDTGDPQAPGEMQSKAFYRIGRQLAE